MACKSHHQSKLSQITLGHHSDFLKLRILVMFSLNLERDKLAPRAASKTSSESEKPEAQGSSLI